MTGARLSSPPVQISVNSTAHAMHGGPTRTATEHAAMHDRRTVRNETHMFSFVVDGRWYNHAEEPEPCTVLRVKARAAVGALGVVIDCNTSFVLLAIVSMSLSRDCKK